MFMLDKKHNCYIIPVIHTWSNTVCLKNGTLSVYEYFIIFGDLEI